MLNEIRKNFWPFLGAMVLVVAALALISSQAGTPKYKQILSAKGYPIDWEDLDVTYPPVPEEENAGHYFVRETQYMGRPDDPLADPPVDPVEEQIDWSNLPIIGEARIEPNEAFPPEMEKAIRQFVALKENILESAYHGAQLDRAWFPAARENWAMQIDHYSPLRETARTLYIDVLRHVLDQNMDGAVRGVLAMLRVADSLAQEPLIMSQLVRLSLRGLAFEAMGEMLSRLKLSEEYLRDLANAIETGPTFTLKSMQTAVAGEAIFLGTFGEQLMAMIMGEKEEEDVDWLSRATAEASAWTLLTTSTVVGQTSFSRLAIGRIVFWTLETGDLPSQVATTQLMDRWQPEYTGQLLLPGYYDDPEPTLSLRAFNARIYANSLSSIYTSGARGLAATALAQAALAIEQYERDYDALPVTLAALTPTYLSETPTDPFSGNPIGYRITSTGYLVYSVGYDHDDDGGIPPQEGKGYWDGDLLFEVRTEGRS